MESFEKTRVSPVSQLFESNEEARTDMEALLQVPDRERLLQAISSQPDLVPAPDPARERIATIGAAAGIESEVLWSALRVFDWLCRNLEDLDVKAFVEDLIQLGLVQQSETEALNAFFGRAIEICMPAVFNRWTVASIMRTFQGVKYACDLRLVKNDEDPSSSATVPVCVVRLQTDEGEPFVLQCMSADLSRLIEVFEDAKKLVRDASSE